MKHILIVDSDRLFTSTVSSVLTKENFTVSVASDGKEAAAKLSAQQFDLVITDMLMPYTNGLELVNTLRKDDGSPQIPVMVVSSIANEHSISSWFRVGADAYFKKPLDLPLLLSGIKQLMRHERHVAA
jgi:DNA-binding response OmpR family regulator